MALEENTYQNNAPVALETVTGVESRAGGLLFPDLERRVLTDEPRRMGGRGQRMVINSQGLGELIHVG